MMSRRLWLPALALALMTPLAEASLPRTTSSAIEPPALTLAAPAPAGFSLFVGDELARSENDHAQGFHPLAAVSLISKGGADGILVSAEELSYPKTRVWAIDVLGSTLVSRSSGLSLETHWACGDFSCGLVSGGRKDPLGLISFGQWVREYAEEAFAGDSLTKKILAGGLITVETAFQVASVGATKKIDVAQEQLERGEITRGQYWKKTTVAVAQTAATYAGGAGAGALGARVGVRALGSRGVTALGVRAAGAIGGMSGGAGGQLAGDVVGIVAGEQEGLSSGETYLNAALIGGAIGAAGALPARTPRDVAVNPEAPAVRPLGRPIGRPSHNVALREEIERALAEGASDFRVNQQQITSATAEGPGVRVGANRPDLQYTNASGRRVFFEFDAPPPTRAVPHAFRLLANDPSAVVYLRTLP